ncbi:response regulator [Herbaspirillum sp. LeCh32-8]|uniref:response regulator transcription factor n=1 Tax=Herbaspirillum sp. LeCh32-8 TaxID=2821356 RepID=UPI001AE39FB8|nr:response regulator [Herbaspirillum sp. LeCh32-8]MBP0598042.1 response regulator [Herbaspirillum sp. LeCh32-8]
MSKIAVVDDDGSMRDALSALVRSLGMAVASYASADAFVAAHAWEDADCIITDVQMPGMSGIELLEFIRCRRLAVPVIVITAYPSAALQARVTAAGNAGFMGKPFDANAMVEQIEQLLEKPSTA